MKIFTPSELGMYLDTMVKRDNILRDVIVEGEVFEYTVHKSSRHHYFTLKDAQIIDQNYNQNYNRNQNPVAGILSCIVYQTASGFVKEIPKDGTKIQAKGQIVVFKGRSTYQLSCKHYQLVGIGDSHQQFLTMQNKLEQSGYFAPERKRRIKPLPRSVALITAETGDAVHDMIDAIQGKCPGILIKIVPTPVQGPAAAPQMTGALDWVNRHNVAEVVVIGRGGGSKQDLNAFNEENLANAIFRSRIPVISAVGHEQDVVISDRVADVRVPTPSRVKDLFLDVYKEKQSLENANSYLDTLLIRNIERKEQEITSYANSPVLQDPTLIFKEKERFLQHISETMQRIMMSKCQDQTHIFEKFDQSLEDLSPKKVLSRGYAVAQKNSGSVVSSTSDLTDGESFTLILQDGEVECVVKKVTTGARSLK